MEKIGANQPLLFLSNIGSNKISDKGCLHISEAHWPKITSVDLSIHRNSSVNCGIREEGCRWIAKQQRDLEFINCKIVVSKVVITK